MDKKPTPADDLSDLLERQIQSSLLGSETGLRVPAIAAGNHPVLPGNPTQMDLVRRIKKLESLLNLYSDLNRQSGQANRIDSVDQISGEAFFDEYYYRNRPVVLKSMMRDWPALKRWSPAYFLERYGDVPVNITRGRQQDAAYEKNFQKTVATVPFREFIRLIQTHPESNDIYIVARNYFFSNPRFHALQDDVCPPDAIIDDRFPGSQKMKLWFGPGGTLTPLHHDKHSILFCQVYGRKHFKMIPSFDLPKIYHKDKYYSEVDPEHIDADRFPEFLKASVADVVIHPGEMLFIPAGWWHWVRSLDVSISVTFSNFRVPGYNTPWQCE